MELADALRALGNEERALLEFGAARATFARMGAAREEGRAAQACGAAVVQWRPAHSPANAHAAVFHREGEYWSVSFGGQTSRLRDSKGLQYLAGLLADPGREFYVLDLVTSGRAATRGGKDEGRHFVPDMGDAGELLDLRAKEAYRRRLVEIDEDLQEARTMGDLARAAQADAERECLVRELARAVGLGGRDRRAGSASERARSAVTRAVRHALTRIRAHNSSLGEYLDRTVRRGTYCAYVSESTGPVEWKF